MNNHRDRWMFSYQVSCFKMFQTGSQMCESFNAVLQGQVSQSLFFKVYGTTIVQLYRYSSCCVVCRCNIERCSAHRVHQMHCITYICR